MKQEAFKIGQLGMTPSGMGGVFTVKLEKIIESETPLGEQEFHFRVIDKGWERITCKIPRCQLNEKITLI